MVRQVSRPSPSEEAESSECKHHWLIESPQGPVSRGICQLCDATREFKNYIDAISWGEESSQPAANYATADASSDSSDDLSEG